ncbi:MAG: hemolysin family protein [Spirochaetota bacterium]|nr:hemolysin family protein [Spirochaetota bacterium]
MTSDDSQSKSNNRDWRKKLNIFFKNKSKTSTNLESSQNPALFLKHDNIKQDIVKGIVELTKKNAREIMIPRVDVKAINSDITQKSLQEIISTTGHSIFPVYKGTIDNIIGMFQVKELFKITINKNHKIQLNKILQKPNFIPETMPLGDILLEFKKNTINFAIVVDEYGGFSGIITLTDIFEEIVGEINDYLNEKEHDLELGDNSYKIDSRMKIPDFNEETGLNLPTDKYDTIGGFVLDIFGKIPEKDETIEYNNLSFKISDIKGTRIDQIDITILDNKNDQ